MADLPKSLVTLTETSYVVAIWNISFHGKGDWMAVVYRDAPEAAWRAMYRFRWYAGPEVWDSRDRREAVHVTMKDGTDADRDRLVDAIEDLGEMIAATHRSTVDRIPVDGDAEAFSTAIRQLPWFHSRSTTIDPPAST